MGNRIPLNYLGSNTGPAREVTNSLLFLFMGSLNLLFAGGLSFEELVLR